MKKLICLIFTTFILIITSAKFSIAAPYWKQSFSQSSSETWDIGAPPYPPIGQFNGIGIFWDTGSKFTINPAPLSGFTTGSWAIDSTVTDTKAFAKSSSLMDNTDFFINFKADSGPLTTSFYYGAFRGNIPIQGQHFSFEGQSWSSYFVDRETFNRIAGVVPEPISLTLFLLGGAALVIRTLHKRKK